MSEKNKHQKDNGQWETNIHLGYHSFEIVYIQQHPFITLCYKCSDVYHQNILHLSFKHKFQRLKSNIVAFVRVEYANTKPSNLNEYKDPRISFSKFSWR